MLTAKNLESKDFSLVLPKLTAKIEAVGNSLSNYRYMSDDSYPSVESCMGFGIILTEVTYDLEMIDDALNSEKSLKELQAKLSQIQAQLSP